MPKISDIKQYKEGHYVVQIPFMSLHRNLEMYGEMNLNLNPDFQRGHVWNEKQQTAYVEHLLKGGQGSTEIRFNCIGWNTNKTGDFVIVDGLQRLTAVRRFLDNEIPVFGHYLNEYEDAKVGLRLTRGLTFRINNLATRKEVLEWYVEINEGGVVHTSEEINRVKELIRKEEN